MTRLAACGLAVDLQILDNEASATCKEAITVKWKAKFQLVPPDMHCRNQAERAIRTLKSHFLSILAGVDSAFPPYLWDLLLPQAELTLNLLQQSTLNSGISAWEYFKGPFDFNKTPLGPAGCWVLIHAKLVTRRSWDFRAKQGFYIGPTLDSYCCFKLLNADTRLPYKCMPIAYEAKTQLTPEADAPELLNNHCKCWVQEIVGSLLYYARAVNNKLLVALSTIATRQSCAMVAIKQAVHLLLDYIATYPSDSIIYQSSNMNLCAHANARFLSKTNPQSCWSAHLSLGE